MMSSPHNAYKLSQAQEKYIRDLMEERSITDEQKQNALERLPDLTKQQASAWIDRLKSLPKRANATTSTGGRVTIITAPDPLAKEPGVEIRSLNVPGEGYSPVPEGSYALLTPDDPINDVKFYRVWIGDRGWKVYVYASDETHPLPFPVQLTILKQIALNPAEAAIRYGKEKGHCAICGRGLTRKESRARGIGPICAEKWGW